MTKITDSANKDFSLKFYGIISLIIVLFALESGYIPHYNAILLITGSFLILAVTKIVSNKFKQNKRIEKAVSGVLILTNLFYAGLVCYYLFADFLDDSPVYPPLSVYGNSLNKLKSKQSNEKVKGLDHFPAEIPENANNYNFQIEKSFDGYNTHYLKFDADQAYIDSIMKKSKCEISANKNNIDKFDVNVYPAELQNADEICVLHKSTQDKPYTSGVSVYKKTNTIYFFYANF